MSTSSFAVFTLAQSREFVEPLHVVTGEPQPVQPPDFTWMLFAAAAMCVVGAVLLAMAITRSVWWQSRRKPVQPREGPELFAAAAESLGVPKTRAKVLLELAESQKINPLGLLLSDHAISRNMVANAIAQREKRLYA